jgi:hypothetical protein
MTGRPVASMQCLANEPIVKLLARLRLTALQASLLFWLLISLPISYWAYVNEQTSGANLSFYQNLSWPVAINLLFPLFIFAVVQFYYMLPDLIGSLVDLCAPSGRDGIEASQIFNRVTRRLRSRFTARIVFLTSVVFTLSIAHQLLNQGFEGWMTEGEYFSFLSAQGSGLTGLGVFALLVELVLMYWVLMFLIQSIFLILAIKEIFESDEWTVRYEPGHADLCCGFKLVGDVSLRIYIALIILGVYLMIKLYDKLLIQDVAIYDDAKSIVFVSMYCVVAPLIFHFSIFRCHRFMRQGRLNLLKPMEKLYGRYISDLRDLSSNPKPEHLIDKLVMQDNAVASLRKRIRVYPFRFVFSPVMTALTPVFSLALSVGLVFFRNGVLVLKSAYLLGALPGH